MAKVIDAVMTFRKGNEVVVEIAKDCKHAHAINRIRRAQGYKFVSIKKRVREY